MSEVRKFEDILVWQKSKTLTLTIYKLLQIHRDYGFRDQIQRASVSIMNNVAEGLERGGDKELKRFLSIAKGSCGEVRSMLHIARELRIISQDSFNYCHDLAIEISKMLSGFIKKIQTTN